MPLNRSFIVLGMLAPAILIGMIRQKSVQALRRANAELAEQIDLAQTQVTEMRSSWEPAQRELAEQRATQAKTAAKLAALARELAPNDPETRWSTPPDQLPDWNPESPYVWIDKELFARFPVQPFTPAGSVNPELIPVLAVEPEQVQRLNERVSNLVAEYRNQEVAHAVLTDQDLPGMPTGEGERLTLEIPALPEIGATLREEFDLALVGEFGPTRADLLRQAAHNWFQEQLSNFGTESRLFSIVRRPEGQFQILIKSGSSQMSVGGSDAFEHYIPPPLRHFFAPLISAPVAETKSEP